MYALDDFKVLKIMQMFRSSRFQRPGGWCFVLGFAFFAAQSTMVSSVMQRSASHPVMKLNRIAWSWFCISHTAAVCVLIKSRHTMVKLESTCSLAAQESAGSSSIQGSLFPLHSHIYTLPFSSLSCELQHRRLRLQLIPLA